MHMNLFFQLAHGGVEHATEVEAAAHGNTGITKYVVVTAVVLVILALVLRHISRPDDKEKTPDKK